jgi:hypothetical protein
MSGDPQGWKRIFLIGSKRRRRLEAIEELAGTLESLLPHGNPARPPGVDNDQAASVANLIRSLDDYQDAVVRIGPLMIVKSGDRMRAHCFSPDEFAHLRRDPGIQDCAPDLIELIDKLAPQPPWPDADPPRGRHRRT